MRDNREPQQISLFDGLQDRGTCERERESKNGLAHIYDSIISFENLLDSWREFAQDKKKQKDVAEFGVRLMDNIFFLRRELVTKTYRHGGYRHARDRKSTRLNSIHT